ncbi:TetR/AcrR family transcriptional regulator [Domibacillus indicus]|uniref:TetR/AcrR family transcriptional regulator n=1 Tax=Domibacillus indicus TaxID=1437523 RepID=UPI000617FED1|nr:TetR/AcrR family transcriptional regulator [Domibacillus indicus]
MPKIVDHDQRKQRIAEATWNVIVKKGIEGATVRAVAAEADVSLGSLRHYFSSQDELLFYAMNLVKKRVAERIESILQSGCPPEQASIRILLELIPYNKESEVEMSVWFHFVMAGTHHKQPAEDGMYEGVERIVTGLFQAGLLKEAVNPAIETERLYALVDGLALHAMLDSKRLPKETIKQVIVHHMNTLFKQPVKEADI